MDCLNTFKFPFNLSVFSCFPFLTFLFSKAEALKNSFNDFKKRLIFRELTVFSAIKHLMIMINTFSPTTVLNIIFFWD